MKAAATRRRRTKKRNEHPARVPASTLTEEAYRLIKWRITTVQLAPGSRFTEPELAESLKLSRTPVREALLLLRTQGLVSVEGRNGYHVSPVTLRDVHDVGLLRRVLESEAASLAAVRLVQASEIATLEARAPQRQDPTLTPNWIESDRRFHLAVAVAGGNDQLVDALDPVLEKSARLLHLVLALDGPAGAILHGHDQLLSALRLHDPEAARISIAEQITALEEAVSRALTSSRSLLTANVVVEKPNNEFYLDAPIPDLDGEKRLDASHLRGLAIERAGSPKTRSEVSR